MITYDIFIKRAFDKFGDKFDYSLIDKDVKGSETKVKIICPKHGIFEKRIKEHLRSPHGCTKCGYEHNGNKFRKKLEDFINESNIQFNNLYDYSKVIYESSNRKVEIICKKHGSFWKSPDHHLRGQGCPDCVKYFDIINNKRHEHIKKNFIKKAKIVHGDEFEYLEDYINSKTKLAIRCRRCGNIFKQHPNNHLSGTGCPFCKMSKGERRIEKYLKENNIEFESQKWFDGCRGKKRPLPFDFYIINKNILIEYQGRQHFEFVDFSHNKNIIEMKNNFKNINITDGIKKQYCEQNNIKLIEIPYWEFDNIEKILNGALICQY